MPTSSTPPRSEDGRDRISARMSLKGDDSGAATPPSSGEDGPLRVAPEVSSSVPRRGGGAAGPSSHPVEVGGAGGGIAPGAAASDEDDASPGPRGRGRGACVPSPTGEHSMPVPVPTRSLRRDAPCPPDEPRSCLDGGGASAPRPVVGPETRLADRTTPLSALAETSSPSVQLWARHLLSASPLNARQSLPTRSAREMARQEALSEGRWNGSPGLEAEVWTRIREQAATMATEEPIVASNVGAIVTTHPNLQSSLAFLLANKLASPALLGTQLLQLFAATYARHPDLSFAAATDLQACVERDPASDSYVQVLLFYKGFQAIQAHRMAHALWSEGRHALALALQSRTSETFAVDIHPAAAVGFGILLDHATGVVIGETAVIGDNVSMLHHITLGGSGTGRGKRHPTVGNGVLIGAGASLLGPVLIGANCKIGAGSVVLADLPARVVAVGVPAKIVKQLPPEVQPAASMDQTGDFAFDYVI